MESCVLGFDFLENLEEVEESDGGGGRRSLRRVEAMDGR